MRPLSYTMRRDLRRLVELGADGTFVDVEYSGIRLPTLEALQTRGLVELEYRSIPPRRWARLHARLTPHGRAVQP